MSKGVYSKTTGELSSSQLIYSGACYCSAIQIKTDGTNNATVTLYDNTSASGKKVFPTWVVAGASLIGGRNIIPMVQIDNGLYIEISGTNAKASVEYVLTSNIVHFK